MIITSFQFGVKLTVLSVLKVSFFVVISDTDILLFTNNIKSHIHKDNL